MTTPVAAPAGQTAADGVRGAIARAAAATGVDFNYLLAQARLESGLDPSARATTSSAAGLYQFTGSTWLAMLDKHGAAYGVPGTDALGGQASRTQLGSASGVGREP
jgi:soluble lytic murein transglycosylase-like protein